MATVESEVAGRRVVVTGLGAVTPLGADVETTWTRLVAGESGAGPITAFDTGEHSVRIACEADTFDPSNWLDKRSVRKLDRFTQFAIAAARMAEADSGIDAIRLGRAEVMLCGGSEAGVTPLAIAGFAAMRALSRRNDDPARASRPFDAERDGFVMGEAGAVVVLEELERAQARGAKIYAEVAGYGLSSDAKHVTEPDPTGENPARAMRNACADAGIDPGEIDYINAHGTSTPLGDAAETRVIKLALGEENACKTPVSSTKGATGHCLGAGGAIEAIFSTVAIRDGKLPPTINQEVEDPECDLDYIPNESRDAEVRVAVSNSFGFGGHNASIVLKRF